MPKVAPGKLTPKQAKFVEGIAEGKPAYKAAVEAYDTDDLNVANAIAVENLQKPTIRAALDEAMVKLNLTAERALKPIDDALDHEDINVRLKGTTIWRSLLPKEPGEGGGNTFVFNNKESVQSFTSK